MLCGQQYRLYSTCFMQRDLLALQCYSLDSSLLGCLCAGRYTDLQFMRLVLGLESVACLPLMSSTHMQGVLCLGYSFPIDWNSLEQVRS